MNQATLLQRVVEWANRQPDIIALIITGSHARRDDMVDELSDYDLDVFATNPERYTSSAGWMREMGEVWVYLPLMSSRGCPTRLAIFEGGLKVDFSIFPVKWLEDSVSSQKLSQLYDRGYRALVDKRDLAAHLPAPSYESPARAQPTEAEFRAAIEEFWFEAAQIPKYLQREDLWVVKHRDWTMKELLLQMLEWHVISINGEHSDVWHAGTRMKDWVRPDVWKDLHEVFGLFDAADSWRALLATVSLFRNLARETAENLGYQYPQQVDDAIGGYLREFEGKFS